MSTAPPYPAYRLRPPRVEDAVAVSDLECQSGIALVGTPDSAPADVVAIWQLPRLDLERDAWIAETADGTIAGHAWRWSRDEADFEADAIADPEHPGARGPLLDRVLARSRALQVEAGTPASLWMYIYDVDTDGAELLTAHGFTRRRAYTRMTILLDGPPDPPVWPEGIDARRFVRGEDGPAVHAAIEEAFLDHFHHVPSTLEEWEQRRYGHENFDPTLWTVAWDGDEVVGAAVVIDHHDIGWVELLGVRRSWRGRGLGLALLRSAFVRLYAKGQPTIHLEVDSASQTGATRLYARAGMHPTFTWDAYQLELG